MDHFNSELIKKLPTVSKMEFCSICRRIPPTYERREGKGSVVVKEDQEGIFTLLGQGKWIGVHTHKEVAFSHAFRWSFHKTQGTIDLEHLRFGSNQPVFLFTLVQVGNSLYRSLSPHHCNEDIYLGQLIFDVHYFQLNWKVVGSKKNEIITMTYS